MNVPTVQGHAFATGKCAGPNAQKETQWTTW